MNFLSKYYWLGVCLLILPLSACSGDSNGSDTLADDLNLQIILPDNVDIMAGGEFKFRLSGDGTLQTSDRIILESAEGISYVCPPLHITTESFGVVLPSECITACYKVYVKRADRKKQLGSCHINVVASNIDFKPQATSTIYGTVTAGDVGIAGVVVSDGVEVAVTNEVGIYELASQKKNGVVFVSIPSGYEVESDGILPLFFQKLRSDAGTLERTDFKLTKVEGQDNFNLFVLGDMHLANRTKDDDQFLDFCKDLNAMRQSMTDQRTYALTLGDMTWDLYWYKNHYALPEYLSTMNAQFKNLQVFHTIGNHDNDYKTTSDAEAEGIYRSLIAPTYYSFNIGKVHFVVLDNIDCDAYDGTTDRNYKKSLSAQQLTWLEKDLKYVSINTPIIMAMHAQVYYPQANGSYKIDHDAVSSNQLFSLLKGRQVHFVTGHTHLSFNVTPEADITNGEEFYEHNSGAVCGSWWWSGYLTPGIHISPDGTPGGYGIWAVNQKQISYQYKAIGRDINHQFRTYDLNRVHFSNADVPLMTSASSTVQDKFAEYTSAYPTSTNNEVLINIWNWNPRWTLTVTDTNGKKLDYTETWAYDPLHIAALSVKRFNAAALQSIPSFVTEKFTHFFKVKADDAKIDLRIQVTDEFGHTYTQEMERPQAFSTDVYQN